MQIIHFKTLENLNGFFSFFKSLNPIKGLTRARKVTSLVKRICKAFA